MRGEGGGYLISCHIHFFHLNGDFLYYYNYDAYISQLIRFARAFSLVTLIIEIKF